MRRTQRKHIQRYNTPVKYLGFHRQHFHRSYHCKSSLMFLGVIFCTLCVIVLGYIHGNMQNLTTLKKLQTCRRIAVTLWVQVPQWSDDWTHCAVDVPDSSNRGILSMPTIPSEKDLTGRQHHGIV